MPMRDPDKLFAQFQEEIDPVDPIAACRLGLIGHGEVFHGPFGPKRLVYADYVASGRALMQVERFILERLLPLYANSHTEASYTGRAMTTLRRATREVIRAQCGAGPEHAVIFTGAGATHGLNRLVHLFDLPVLVAAGKRPAVLIGPYEHHSNILPWRESGAEVVEIPEAAAGGPNLDALDAALSLRAGRPLFGSFSAASNVTGILTDVRAVTRRLKEAGARVVWDFAGGGPYIPIDMGHIDAVVISPHKFIGGPQSSGVLILRRDAATAARPTFTGGGTVRFVSPVAHDYAGALEAREEAGTPNGIGDLRAALAFLVKAAIGQATISERNCRNRDKALAAWGGHARIELLGNTDCDRLPIFAFRIRDGRGGYMHHQLVTRLLSDAYGIQGRGGCACAGPYVHRLLGIDTAASEVMRTAILQGREVEKLGFVRLNLSYLADDAEVNFILASVIELAETAGRLAANYICDSETAIFRPAA